MISSYDKALAALAMAVIFLVNQFFGLGINVSPETINTVVAVVTPVLVYLVPNRPPA